MSPLARQIASTMFLPEQAQPPDKETSKETARVQAILEGLRKGKITRSLFTENANAYFSEAALRDCRASLAALGKLKSVAATGENLRGGMIHRSYRALFEKKAVVLNIYVLPSGKYEQFMVEE